MGDPRTNRRGLAFVLVAAVVLWGAPAVAQTVVRAVMHAEVKHLDPHWTTANITQAHGYMIYETLFALDSKGVPRPQMVDRYTMSADKLTYTFTLRKGVKFHNGAELTSADVLWNWTRYMDPKTDWRCRSEFDGRIGMKVTSVTAPDPSISIRALSHGPSPVFSMRQPNPIPMYRPC